MLITDHPFEPSLSYPDGEGCSHIIDGASWTIFDPHRCRKPEREHERTLRDKEKE